MIILCRSVATLHSVYPYKLSISAGRLFHLNLFNPNDIYICLTAAQTSRRYILNIYSTNIHTEYFKMLHNLRFFLFKMQFIS